MKNNKYIIASLLVVTMTTGCEKFVDYAPKEDFQITSDDYLKTSDDYQKMVVACYSPLQWLWANPVIGDIASDNSVSGGENATDQIGFQEIDNYQITANNGNLTEAWKSCYEGINRVNYLEENKTKLDFVGKDALYGEIYFLRAYYYFELVRMFGDVPLFVDKRLGVSDSKGIPRTAKADVYKQIELDLNNAIAANLPNVRVAAEPGRITKYAAQALLGKVLLYQGKFDAAAAMLENVVNGPFSLVTNFGNVFLQAGENGTESVFEIQYSNISPFYDWSNPGRGQGNLAVQVCGIRNITGSSPYGEGWSTNLPTVNLANAYAAGDTRKAVTILDIEAYKAANPQFNIKYTVAPYRNTGLYNQKYLPRKGETSGQVELNYLNNYRTIRYADVLLMAAEANNRATTPNDTKAQGYLNRVRQRAFADQLHNITSTGTALRQAIWDERRLELAMEGDRFFDLVRTGQAAAKITGFMVGRNEIFPIPQQEIDISGYTQNPNYN
ncbi:RagB/SusD family nutrient uptake outer membrane protein [Pedobacter cryophilus]|uniref:RagB/SusD family nutrient uptake outer membrane protein n=1 Tax=Pedobacter cryophilus TaxID=2571271 RepID=A0A4U1C5J1_9SPHI|nr:RagB/SusD family nutrient uptake outer membrane protein [Pedobacter cryophilus]TKC00622.1 RagB/SusD family nutrient uptake outer membrane protein [Pedobacter cryophilus]